MKNRVNKLAGFTAKLKDAGFKVYASDCRDNRPITYIFFENASGIGYVEGSDYCASFSSVHKVKPGSGNGDGYGMYKDVTPTIELAESTITDRPVWAAPMTKYASFAEYDKDRIQILTYTEI